MNITQEQPEENREKTLIDTMAEWQAIYETQMQKLFILVEEELGPDTLSKKQKKEIIKRFKEFEDNNKKHGRKQV